MRQRLLPGAIALLVLLVYWPTLHFQLVYDDIHQLVYNPRLTAWSYVPGYFTSHLWSQQFTAPHYYRPVFLLWFRLVYMCLGVPGSKWHAASILAHLVTVFCVFILIRRLTGSLKGAALSTTIFAIYPLNTEVVAWVSASGDLLLTIFVVLSVFYYARRRGRISLASIVFVALAMFVKETGIVAPVLIFAYEWTQSRFRNAVVSTLPYAVPALLYFAFRIRALGTTFVVSAPSISIGTMILTWPRVLAVYLVHLVWPVNLSAFYDVPTESRLWPLLLLLTIFGILLGALRASAPMIRFGFVWFSITLIPALAIRYLDWNDYVHDRYLYLPMVGLALIAAVWFSRITFNRAQVTAACALVSVLCWTTYLNLGIWRDNISLFSRAVKTAPKNPVVKNDLIVSLFKVHRDSEALLLLQQLLQQYPSFPDAYRTMALYYHQIGNPAEAERYDLLYEQMSNRPLDPEPPHD